MVIVFYKKILVAYSYPIFIARTYDAIMLSNILEKLDSPSNVIQIINHDLFNNENSQWNSKYVEQNEKYLKTEILSFIGFS